MKYDSFLTRQKAKRIDNGDWVEGFYTRVTNNYTPKNVHYIETFADLQNGETVLTGFFDIDPDTVCFPTGQTDKNGKMIWTGDIVEFLGMRGEVKFECGAFGIAFDEIDWDYMEERIPEITGCNNSLCACLNDNFISLWEIAWNFNEEENYLSTVDILGNIYDNPELLEEVKDTERE